MLKARCSELINAKIAEKVNGYPISMTVLGKI